MGAENPTWKVFKILENWSVFLALTYKVEKNAQGFLWQTTTNSKDIKYGSKYNNTRKMRLFYNLVNTVGIWGSEMAKNSYLDMKAFVMSTW